MTPAAGEVTMNDWYCEWLVRRGDTASSLADALERAIRRGHLQPGDRLPTHRDLSRQVGVAVSTVSRAYAEAARRGLIRGSAGRGTFVLDTAGGAGTDVNGEALRPLERLYLPIMQRADAINLSLNEPMPDGVGERLRDSIRALAAAPDLDGLAHYQPPQGQARHREAGSKWLRALGVDAAPDGIFAVPGGQTALMTIFLGLARPGDTVLTEELTWPGALAVARLSGIRLIPVGMDSQGLLPEAFEAACARHRPRFLYTMPTLHNPTNATAGPARRREIARIARERQVLIVEDDAYGFLAEPRGTPYWELASDRTVYLTSLSKAVSPALRVGFMAVPARLRTSMLAAMRATTVMVSPVLLEMAAHMIDSGAGEAAAAYQAGTARRRQNLAASILGADGSAPASFHYWLRLPRDVHNAAFAAEALARGVAVTHGDVFLVAPGQEAGGVRLCLCAEPDDGRVEHALRTLAGLLDVNRAEAIPIV